ncbi:MAG: hypothetical protein ACP5F8_02285, partial [Candidatus Aenigmatarchaeota archaeon]
MKIMNIPEYLIKNVMEQYKIKDRGVAMEIAKQIFLTTEARGKLYYYEDSIKAFGKEYVAKEMIKDYQKDYIKKDIIPTG